MDDYSAWRRSPEGKRFGENGGNLNSSPVGLR
jgi:hypothetical protein